VRQACRSRQKPGGYLQRPFVFFLLTRICAGIMLDPFFSSFTPLLVVVPPPCCPFSEYPHVPQASSKLFPVTPIWDWHPQLWTSVLLSEGGLLAIWMGASVCRKCSFEGLAVAASNPPFPLTTFVMSLLPSRHLSPSPRERPPLPPSHRPPLSQECKDAYERKP